MSRKNDLGCWAGILILLAIAELVIVAVARSHNPEHGLLREVLRLNLIILAIGVGYGTLNWIFDRISELAHRCSRCGGPMKIVGKGGGVGYTTTTYRCLRCEP